MADFDIDQECTCPKCGHTPTHSRSCINFCDEGLIDEYDDDPINFAPGEQTHLCPDCKGTGIERWCPSCGEDLSGQHIADDEDTETFHDYDHN